MVAAVLTEFIRYNNWANRQVLDACDKLSEEELATPIPGAFGTIRETVRHIIEAEAFYIGLLTGDAPQPPYEDNQVPTVAEMKTYSGDLGAALVELADQFKVEDMVYEEGDGWELHYRSLALFIQIVNHGVEHRTNITTVLNQGLQEPPKVDGWEYLWEHTDTFDVKRIGEE